MKHKWFAAFFTFGAIMSALTAVLLLFPGTILDRAWQLNPKARLSLQSFGWRGVALMSLVSAGCACAAVGLWRGARWGLPIALVILSINLVGDLLNASLRGDYRTLIGLPIGGAMIFYLVRPRKRDTSLSK